MILLTNLEEKNMYVIAGLGNPDKKYEMTRHNMGFRIIDALAGRFNISMTEQKHIIWSSDPDYEDWRDDLEE